MNRKFRMAPLLATLLVLAGSAASADEKDEGPAVVPRAEREQAAKKSLQGPTANKGVLSVTTLGSVNLSGEFASTDGRQLRSREIVVEPGGVIAVHEHDARPGIAYILEGEIVEHRNDHPTPITRKQGDVAIEKTGVAHWWENRTNSRVRALVVDIVSVN